MIAVCYNSQGKLWPVKPTTGQKIIWLGKSLWYGDSREKILGPKGTPTRELKDHSDTLDITVKVVTRLVYGNLGILIGGNT